MNLTEYLLSSLGEECVEIEKETSKANRFGLFDKHAETDNLKKIISELNDLQGIIEILQENGTLPNDFISRIKVEAKKKKVLK